MTCLVVNDISYIVQTYLRRPLSVLMKGPLIVSSELGTLPNFQDTLNSPNFRTLEITIDETGAYYELEIDCVKPLREVSNEVTIAPRTAKLYDFRVNLMGHMYITNVVLRLSKGDAKFTGDLSFEFFTTDDEKTVVATKSEYSLTSASPVVIESYNADKKDWNSVFSSLSIYALGPCAYGLPIHFGADKSGKMTRATTLLTALST